MTKENVSKILTELSFDEGAIKQLDSLLKSTLKTNQLFNLTAITKEDEFWEKMIFDSFLPLKHISLSNCKCIDIGTGAGFPGLVLSILSKTPIDLLDSNHKKINYLSSYAKENNIPANCIAARAEEYASTHRETYDYAFVRSVADLKILIEIISPLLKVGGTLVAYKGKNYLNEISNSTKLFKLLNLELMFTQKETLPCGEDRYILYIKKTAKTNLKYPRPYKDIVKK